MLQANLALNAFTQVQAEQLALGAAAGVLELHLPPTDAHQDYLVTKLAIPGWEPVEVPCATLDESFARWGVSQIDLLKIDVEGAEPEVIAGGRAVLSSGRVRAMVCEFSGAHLQRSGLTAQAVIADLEGLGFQHARVDRAGRLVPHPLPMLRSDRDCNLVFVHRASMGVGAT